LITGNFTGASINAVTKSGSTYLGTIHFAKTENLIWSLFRWIKQEAAAFNDYTYGVSIWCDCKKQIILFNAELADRNEAVLNAPGSSTSNISQETVTLIADRLKSKYNLIQVFRQMQIRAQEY
jgi:hypothetical protein